VSAALGVLPWVVAAWLLACGLWGVATSRNLVHLVVCLSVMQASTYAALLGLGWRKGGAAPVVEAGKPPPSPMVDGLVQAMMLTDVVVGATVSALLLALAAQVRERAHTLDPERLRRLRG
jgi:multicomponent Na+:H+ antiporter subunit C